MSHDTKHEDAALAAAARIGQTLGRRHVLDLSKARSLLSIDEFGHTVLTCYGAYLAHLIGHISAETGLTPAAIIQHLADADSVATVHAN